MRQKPNMFLLVLVLLAAWGGIDAAKAARVGPPPKPKANTLRQAATQLLFLGLIHESAKITDGKTRKPGEAYHIERPRSIVKGADITKVAATDGAKEVAVWVTRNLFRTDRGGIRARDFKAALNDFLAAQNVTEDDILGAVKLIANRKPWEIALLGLAEEREDVALICATMSPQDYVGLGVAVVLQAGGQDLEALQGAILDQLQLPAGSP